MKRFGSLVLVLVTSAWALAGCGTRAAAGSSPSAAVILEWNTTAVNTVRAGVPFQAEGMIYMTYVQAAVYDAVTAIEGGYKQYRTNLSAPDGSSSEAAAVAAAHKVLVNYFKGQAASLDDAYARSMSSIADGAAKTQGVAVGEQAADAIIALRAADVRSGSDGYVFGSPGPGVWRLPTPDATASVAQTPWIRSLTPFMLESPSQFRSAPPPDLSSDEYATQLAEVQAYGGVGSAVRTDEQSTIARFWTANVINQYNLFLRAIAAGHSMKIEDAARLLAMGNMVSADASIACWDSKYAYSFWRPVQAIRGAAPNPDPSWKPFLAPTPNHPEYPSAHGCLTSALLIGVGVVLGTKQINVDIPGLNPATGLLDPNYTRHFETEKDAMREMEGARVWAGFHYRGSVVAGANLGRQVAHFTLARNFQAE